MIKPSDAPRTSPSPSQEAAILACTENFDYAIREAHATGQWPALVRIARDGIVEREGADREAAELALYMPTVVLEEIARRYRAIGWRVDLHPAHGIRASINHQDGG